MWSDDFWQGLRDHSVGKGQYFQHGVGKTGYPNAKELSWTLMVPHIQRLTQNGSKTQM